MKLLEAAQVIGVQDAATEAQIKRAYRRLAIRFHPDKFTEPLAQDSARRTMARINSAWEVIEQYLNDGGVLPISRRDTPVDDPTQPPPQPRTARTIRPEPAGDEESSARSVYTPMTSSELLDAMQQHHAVVRPPGSTTSVVANVTPFPNRPAHPLRGTELARRESNPHTMQLDARKPLGNIVVYGDGLSRKVSAAMQAGRGLIALPDNAVVRYADGTCRTGRATVRIERGVAWIGDDPFVLVVMPEKR